MLTRRRNLGSKSTATASSNRVPALLVGITKRVSYPHSRGFGLALLPQLKGRLL